MSLHDVNRANDPIGKASQGGFARTVAADHGRKNACLLAMASALEQDAVGIKEANALDMEVAREDGPFLRHARPAEAG